MSGYKRADGSKRICRCECGGWVRGVEDFGRLFTYCTKCTPVQTIKITPKGPVSSPDRTAEHALDYPADRISTHRAGE